MTITKNILDTVEEYVTQFYSEKIAEILYKGEDTKGLLKLAEEKAKYFKIKKQGQEQ